ncbi:MAG: hypothetical protein K2P84_08605 [Undibacterium sp.]|nr:hypothetical protein [Undibacterium sp.]
MKIQMRALPFIVTILLALVLMVYGAIPQLSHYHEFADQSSWQGVPHAMDVLSNIGFLVAAVLGLRYLVSSPKSHGYYGYALFIFSILATSFCSSYYHLAPDDARLLWDRLPIALACAGLLAGVRAELLLTSSQGLRDVLLLVVFAVASVVWWQYSGDLRPYLALQILSLVLIPLWQSIYQAPLRQRLVFAWAIALYVLAKICELNDTSILNTLQVISGHSLKHLFAALAAGLIIWQLDGSNWSVTRLRSLTNRQSP